MIEEDSVNPYPPQTCIHMCAPVDIYPIHANAHIYMHTYVCVHLYILTPYTCTPI